MLFEPDPSYGICKEALDGLAYRENLLVNNIANLGTPGYVARDVDFHRVLTSLASHQNEASFGSGPAWPASRSEIATLADVPQISGNPWQRGTVRESGKTDLRSQMVALSQNGIQFSAVAQVLEQQLGLYRQVIREGK